MDYMTNLDLDKIVARSKRTLRPTFTTDGYSHLGIYVDQGKLTVLTPVKVENGVYYYDLPATKVRTTFPLKCKHNRKTQSIHAFAATVRPIMGHLPPKKD